MNELPEVLKRPTTTSMQTLEIVPYDLDTGEYKKEKRYTVTLDLHVWAKDDNEVIKLAQELAKKLSEKEVDNKAKVLDIYETPFGVFDSRAVKITEGGKII